MACIHGSIGRQSFIVSVCDEVYDIQVGCRRWRFEDHRALGPMPIHRRTGSGIDGTKAFWRAVTLWAQQGRRVTDDGVAVWDEPEMVPVYRLSRGNYTTDAKMAARFGITEPHSFVPKE